MSYLKNLKLLLSGRPVKKTVWAADLEYWISGREADGTADPRWRTEEGFLELNRSLGIMPYYWYKDFWLAEPVYDHTVSVKVKKNGSQTDTEWETPFGSINESVKFMPESCSLSHLKYPVQNGKDLDIFRYIIEHRHLRTACVSGYEGRRGLYAEYDGLPAVAMPRSPLPAFFYEWAGVMNGVYLLSDYPDKVNEIFSLMEAQEGSIIDDVCRLKPEIVHFADNVSGNNMGGYYGDLMAPFHKKRIERFHSAGISCAVHLDGSVSGILPQLVRSGFDIIEALTPLPGGDMDIADMRSEAGSDSVILWGGVPGVLFSPSFKWKEVETHVKKVLDAWEGTPFILGVADQVPADGKIEYVQRISEMI